MRMASLGALFQGNTTGRRDWIDHAVGRDADVSFVWSGQADAFTLWQNEFFNRSVGRVYELANPLGGGLPATEATIDPRNGELLPHAQAEYALTDESVPLAGVVVAQDRPKKMVLYRVEGPLRETQLVAGLYGDTWSGPRVTYTRLDCAGGTVSVQVSSDPHLFRRAQTLRAAGRRFVVRPTEPLTVTVPLERSPAGRCVARFTVSPTAVPGNGDPRRLGLHFGAFSYAP
jgi:hypothetical protein